MLIVLGFHLIQGQIDVIISQANSRVHLDGIHTLGTLPQIRMIW